MIGTKGALVILIFNLLATGILGAITGVITSLILQQRWRIKNGFTDATVATLTALFSASILTLIDEARGTLQSRLLLDVLIAVGAVVLTHVVRCRQSAKLNEHGPK